MDENKFFAKNFIVIIVFTVLSAVLGLIKMPFLGSIAFDSAPGFFVSVFISPLAGGLVGMLGHVASAATGGFPLGGLHIYVSIEMFIWCYVFGYISKLKRTKTIVFLSGALAILLNGVIGPLILTFTPFFNLEYSLVKILIPILSLASFLNVLLATIAYLYIIQTKAPNI